MELEFRTKNDKQLEAAEAWLDDTTEEILFGGGKAGGKSFLGCTLIFGDALIYPNTHYFIARKELNDLRKFTIPSIHEVFENWKLKIDDYTSFNGQDNVYNLTNGSKVYLIACSEQPSDPLFERFGSMQMTRGWIEEGGEVPENAKANLALSIGRWNNEKYNLKRKLLITANPKKGWMKRDFVDPFFKGELPINRRFIRALATDNPYLSQDYVTALANERDPIRRQRLFEGDWDYDEDKDSLVSMDALTDMFTNTIDLDGKRYMVVDVARLGQDSTVISVWDGLELSGIQKLTKQATSTIEQRIKDVASANRIPYSNILIDEDGIGGGVVDHLVGVKGFMANSAPLPTGAEIRTRQSKLQHEFVPKTNFKNLKAQCGWKLAEMINEHKIAVRVPEYRDEIITDLSAMLRDREVDNEGKKQLKSKESVKQDIGHSPDCGDTMLMRMFFELRNDALSENPERVVALKQQKDILDRNRMRRNLNNVE